MDDLSPHIQRRRFLILAAKTKAKVLPTERAKLFGEVFLKEREIPKQLEKIDPKPYFEVLEIDGSVPHFAKMVLHHLLGKPLRDPPLVVDLEKSHVIVRGVVHAVDASVAHIIDQLLKGNGNPISRSTMQKNSQVLKEENRIDRIIKDIREQELLPVEIQSDPSKRGYFLSLEWLA